MYVFLTISIHWEYSYVWLFPLVLMLCNTRMLISYKENNIVCVKSWWFNIPTCYSFKVKSRFEIFDMPILEVYFTLNTAATMIPWMNDFKSVVIALHWMRSEPNLTFSPKIFNYQRRQMRMTWNFKGDSSTWHGCPIPIVLDDIWCSFLKRAYPRKAFTLTYIKKIRFCL